jgi:HSP20 family protein
MSSLVRFEPLSDLLTFRSAMDRLFDETMGQTGPGLGGFGAPAIDLYQTDDDVVVRASLPGVHPKDLNITVTGDVLTLRGEVQELKELEGAQVHIKERRFGSFTRSIGLPSPVVAEKADAQFENGILTLRLPKAEEVKPKTITVKAK